jgi:hypothetical protein
VVLRDVSLAIGARRVDDAAEALCRFGSPDRGFYRVADERFSLNR